MKIYTRTGDAGDTALFGGGRVRKDDARVEAYGEVDELSATIGLAIVEAERIDGKASERLRLIQEDLFSIGAHLATPAIEGAAASHLPSLPAERIAEMEAWIDEADGSLPPLRNFILPGGTESAARLHLARAVCRRAERRVLTLAAVAPVNGTIIVYLNRLSDLLFMQAREANTNAGREDVPWLGRRPATDG